MVADDVGDVVKVVVVVGEVVAVVDGVDVCEEVAVDVPDVVGVDKWHSENVPSSMPSTVLPSASAATSQSSPSTVMKPPMVHVNDALSSPRV